MVDELILKQSILEGNIREILRNIRELQYYEATDGFCFNKQELSEMEILAENLVEKANQLECIDLEDEKPEESED